MSSANRLIISILVVAGVAVAFWVLLLSPKREEANELGSQASQLEISLAESQSAAREAEAARHEFPADYRKLVLLGQAAPESDETASLLVELDHIASRSKVQFESIALASSAGATAEVPAAAPETPSPEPSGAEPTSVQASATVPPTEVAASLLPLGATIGPAGLDVMPYTLSFSGDFFHIADFIEGIDSLVKTRSSVAVDGRLITLNGFSLTGDATRGFPFLDATFSVTTYLIPPGQGLTAGASPTQPGPAATPVAEASGTEAETSEASDSAETAAAR
jgi:Tfp pilus assembly protein PilO